MAGLEVVEQEHRQTPYGAPSGPITRGRLGDAEFLFLPRHGCDHSIPPHTINYRANVWALKDCGADRVVALAACGGIGPAFGPLVLAIPDQLIDYTYGRAQSFHDGSGRDFQHIDFTRPYCEELRQALVQAVSLAGLGAVGGGTYGITQGPRLETAAEIKRMQRDGCDLVGMSGMPEAALAKEIGLCYACFAFVVNWAAGKAAGDIQMEEIQANIDMCASKIVSVLKALCQSS
jgi:5'-methylthioadenosine phosphorylase/5'-methylthioinosine phosphorylase